MRVWDKLELQDFSSKAILLKNFFNSDFYYYYYYYFGENLNSDLKKGGKKNKFTVLPMFGSNF